MERFWSYWGKSGEGSDIHPLVFHKLDVAATGLALLEAMPKLHERLSEVSGLCRNLLKRWIGFFLALHDLGKFSRGFQQLNKSLHPRPDSQYPYTIRHDTLGYIAWRKLFAYDELLLDQLAAWQEDDCDDDDPLDLIDTWIQCVTGHHGKPPDTVQAPMADHFSPADQEAIKEWVSTAAQLFLPSSPLPLGCKLSVANGRRHDASWLLAGFCTLADWLGSNRDHFPFRTAPMDPHAYLQEIAIPQARRAIAASGLLPVAGAEFSGLPQLFDFIDTPTPLQAACLETPLANTPQLHILEDVTGAGKTEAAFILMARLIANGHANGAYIALPTMATANAMYRRTAGVYRKLFRENSQPASLVLAHGSRRLDLQFTSSLIHPHQLPGEGEYERDEFDAEARCNAWLADNNKKALLAHIGVGTIDQALLAVLQSKHQSMRLLGLVGKVLLVDEVHASDAYMHTLLCQLLTMHARAGGSAILLSATLSEAMRKDLIRAWGGHIEDATSMPEELLPYPLLTSVAPHSQAEYRAVATREMVRRKLTVRLVHEPELVHQWIVEQAKQGSCIAWIRNTVNDAIEAWQTLSRELGEDRVVLFHARFAMGDRLDIENVVLEAFGPKSGTDSRLGKVVVATQVIEQSLDLDFDEMVSDLAPIDLLIQRAGRLHRHRRDAEGNLLKGEKLIDQRSRPCLHVLSPAPETEAGQQWIRRLLPGTAAVYPDHGQLWLTAHELSQRKRLQIPEDLRELIESVYAEDAIERVPEALRTSSERAEGKAFSDRSVARLNAIKPATGYRCQDGQWLDESLTPTRLGEDSVTVRLAHWQNGGLKPVTESETTDWTLSECRIAARHLARLPAFPKDIEDAIEDVKSLWPKKLRKTTLVPVSVEKDGEPDRSAREQEKWWRYSKRTGLMF